MMRRIVNNLIEVEWKNPVHIMKYEGDDVWDSDEDGYLCGFKLHILGKEESGSQILYSDFDHLLNLGSNSKAGPLKLNVKTYFQESCRQYILGSSIFFDYRQNVVDIPLSDSLKLNRLTEGVFASLNPNGELEYIILENVYNYEFYFGSVKSSPIFLKKLEDNSGAKIWGFYKKSLIYQYGCSNSFYRELIKDGNKLLEEAVLPKDFYNYLNQTLDFWEDLVDNP